MHSNARRNLEDFQDSYGLIIDEANPGEEQAAQNIISAARNDDAWIEFTDREGFPELMRRTFKSAF